MNFSPPPKLTAQQKWEPIEKEEEIKKQLLRGAIGAQWAYCYNGRTDGRMDVEKTDVQSNTEDINWYTH